MVTTLCTLMRFSGHAGLKTVHMRHHQFLWLYCFHTDAFMSPNPSIATCAFFFFFFFLLCLGVLYHPGTSLLGCLVCLTPRGFFLSALCSGTTCISLCCSKAAVLQALPRPSLLLGNLGGCCCNVSSLSACVWVLQWARISKVKVKLSVYANLKL